MGALLDIAGLIGSFVGIVTIQRYSLPLALPPLPALLRALTETDASENDRRHLIGLGGLVLFFVGTVLQIFATAMRGT